MKQYHINVSLTIQQA